MFRKTFDILPQNSDIEAPYKPHTVVPFFNVQRGDINNLEQNIMRVFPCKHGIMGIKTGGEGVFPSVKENEVYRHRFGYISIIWDGDSSIVSLRLFTRAYAIGELKYDESAKENLRSFYNVDGDMASHLFSKDEIFSSTEPNVCDIRISEMYEYARLNFCEQGCYIETPSRIKEIKDPIKTVKHLMTNGKKVFFSRDQLPPLYVLNASICDWEMFFTLFWGTNFTRYISRVLMQNERKDNMYEEYKNTDIFLSDNAITLQGFLYYYSYLNSPYDEDALTDIPKDILFDLSVGMLDFEGLAEGVDDGYRSDAENDDITTPADILATEVYSLDNEREENTKELSFCRFCIPKDRKYLSGARDDIRIYVKDQVWYAFMQNPVTRSYLPTDIKHILSEMGAWDLHIVYDGQNLLHDNILRTWNICKENISTPTLKDLYFCRLLSAEQMVKIPYLKKMFKRCTIEDVPDLSQPLKQYLGISPKAFKDIESITEYGVGKGMRLADITRIYKDAQIRAIYTDPTSLAMAGILYALLVQRTYCTVSPEDIIRCKKTIVSLLRKIRKGENNPEREFNIYEDYVLIYLDMEEYIREEADSEEKRTVSDIMNKIPISPKLSKLDFYNKKLSYAKDLSTQGRIITENNPKIEKIKKEYSGKYEYSDDNYMIILPKDAKDIVREGAELSHCVGRAGYIEQMAKKETIIAFLRRKNESDTSFLTLEIKNNAIIQCYGFHDTYNSNKDVEQFLRKYAMLRGFSIVATIYKEKRG